MMTDDQIAASIADHISAARFDLARLSAGRAGDPGLAELRAALEGAFSVAVKVRQDHASVSQLTA